MYTALLCNEAEDGIETDIELQVRMPMKRPGKE
jgi:hypothetical protein